MKRRDGVFSIYTEEISKFSLLTAEEEKELAYHIQTYMRLRKEGVGVQLSQESFPYLQEIIRNGEESRKRLIESNLPLVISIAKDYCNRGIALDDLIQVGNIGLMKVTERYDGRGKFSTYAAYAIKGEIRHEIRERGRFIKLSAEVECSLPKVKKYLRENHLNFITREAQRSLGLTQGLMERVNDALKVTHMRSYPREGTAEERPEIERIVPKNEASYQEIFENSVEVSYLRNLLKKNLSQRDVALLEMRYGLNGYSSMTHEEIGKKINLSRVRVTQIVQKALRMLKRDAKKSLYVNEIKHHNL